MVHGSLSGIDPTKAKCDGKMASCSSPPPQLADHNTRTGLVFSVRGPIPIQLGINIT